MISTALDYRLILAAFDDLDSSRLRSMASMASAAFDHELHSQARISDHLRNLEVEKGLDMVCAL